MLLLKQVLASKSKIQPFLQLCNTSAECWKGEGGKDSTDDNSIVEYRNSKDTVLFQKKYNYVCTWYQLVIHISWISSYGGEYIV